MGKQLSPVEVVNLARKLGSWSCPKGRAPHWTFSFDQMSAFAGAISSASGEEGNCGFEPITNLVECPTCGHVSLNPDVKPSEAEAAGTAGGADQLHAAIMNIPPRRKSFALYADPDLALECYMEGHRDARHAAAELVLDSPSSAQGEQK